MIYENNRCSSTNESYTTVDLLKFFFCLCVIAIHTYALSFLPDEMEFYITHVVLFLAVPYFFVASGFFLRKKYSSVQKSEYSTVLKSYLKRLLFPFVVFTLIWVSQQWVTQMLAGQSKTDVLLYLLQRVLFNPFGALWFVQALLVAAIITYPLMKFRHGVNICLIIGLVLYAFALLCNNYYFVVENTRFEMLFDYYMTIFLTPRNGIFVGILFLSLGMKCFDIFNKVRNSSGGGTAVRIFSLLFMVAYILEVTLLHISEKKSIDDGAYYVVHIFLIPSIFLLSILYSVRVPSNVSITLRNLSTGMYYLHRPIQWWLAFYITDNVIMFITVTIITFTICVISYKTKFKNKYYLLR